MRRHAINRRVNKRGLKVSDWVILAVLGAMFTYIVLRPSGATDKEVELLLKVQQLENERKQLELQYNELSVNIEKLERRIVTDSIFVNDATNAQIDSLFTDYFGQHKMFHVPRSAADH